MNPEPNTQPTQTPDDDFGSQASAPEVPNAEHSDDLLDEAIEESFPASDPPSPATRRPVVPSKNPGVPPTKKGLPG